jgi:hypothetical protein
VLLRRGGEHGDEARPAADCFHREPAPELEPAADLERLPAVDRNKSYALAAQPIERREAMRDQKLDEVGIGAMLRHQRHVVEKLCGGVGAEIRARDFRRREIGHERLDVVDAVIDHADRTGSEAAVAAGFFFRRRFEHEHTGASFLRRERGTERGVAGADNDHIGIEFAHAPASGTRIPALAAAARLGAAAAKMSARARPGIASTFTPLPAGRRHAPSTRRPDLS